LTESLVGYCGLYCGACGIYQGRIKQAVENLRKIMGYYGFDKIASELMTWEQSFQHYAEYEKVLDGIVKLFGECPGCVSGGGDPNCSIRQCCAPRGYATCAECGDLEECPKLWRRGHMKELQRIRAMGVEEWARHMQKKVEAGYCDIDEKIK